MKRTFFLLLISLTVCIACNRKLSPEKEFAKSLFKATDHTAENLLSRNIEGPAVDKQGRLFVVNYQKDGTIGLVQPDGSVELFVTLPDKSIGNSIQFNAEGNMLVADFTGHNILEVNTQTKAVTVYCHNDNFNQPNDLCINKKGIVFASDPNWQKQSGQIWKIGTDRTAVLVKGDMGT